MPAARKPAANKTTTTRTPRATAAQKPNTAAITMDDLLAHDEPEDGGVQAPAVPDNPAAAPDEEPKQDKPEEDSLEDEEIARLQAELAEANNKRLAPSRGARPLAETELTPKQREIRALRDQVAQAKAKAFENAEEQYESEGGVRVIHFVADGFTAQGRTWLTGQTVEFGDQAFEQTLDRFGNSWIDLTESEQWDRYGKVFFREGPWRGATYDDDVARADSRRGAAAPLITL